tara:strand:+ start:1018 stop:1398 length:381 start_codon:yes stop_codon:yes gene_type:complete
MPSKRKRIGYLPSINAQEMITKIANREKLSHSKVVGILVEEALLARVRDDLQQFNDQIKYNLYDKLNTSSFNDIDELISDKGITYNTKRHNYSSFFNSNETRLKFNDELFEQFKQFILFQKMAQEK